MKRVNYVAVLLGAIGALFFAGAKQSVAGQSEYYSRGANGLLRMKHSPALGINIPIAVWIDGVQAGAFGKRHVYERSLSPGRHDLYACRPGRSSESWFGTADARPGGIYSLVVEWKPGQ